MLLNRFENVSEICMLMLLLGQCVLWDSYNKMHLYKSLFGCDTNAEEEEKQEEEDDKGQVKQRLAVRYFPGFIRRVTKRILLRWICTSEGI